MYFRLEFETLIFTSSSCRSRMINEAYAIKASDQNVEIVGKNGLQILTFSRSLQTGKMSSSSRNGGRQTANTGNVRSRDHLCRSREKIRGA